MNISDVEAAQEAWEKAVQGMGLQLPAWHSLGPMLAALESFALSHAAGQDGEQCRAASGFELLELAAIFESCVPFLPPVGQRNITKAVAELRALSRGVPEGDSSDPERYRILRDWFLRGGKLSEILPAGHVKRYSEAEFDAEIDRIRAIAAQRKEG